MTPLDPGSAADHLVWSAWAWNPVITGGIAALAAGYLVAVTRVRRHHPNGSWPVVRTASFLLGLAGIALATESAIAVYDDELLSAHMIQHLLLIMAAPPLLIYGRPLTVVLHAWGNPVHAGVRRVLRARWVTAISHPAFAAPLLAAVVVGTHLTPFMTVALEHPLVHDCEHVLYLAAGYLFFLSVIASEPVRPRLSAGARYLLVLAVMPIDGVVGLIWMLDPHVLFAAYAHPDRTWGPSPLADQHLAGAIMFMGGDSLMIALGIVLAVQLVFRQPNRPSADDAQRLAAYNEHLRALSAHVQSSDATMERGSVT
jgi:cytochrome c oxidase assembly factor CtaG